VYKTAKKIVKYEKKQERRKKKQEMREKKGDDVGETVRWQRFEESNKNVDKLFGFKVLRSLIVYRLTLPHQIIWPIICRPDLFTGVLRYRA
jgi:hypothetical protein